MDLVEMLSCLNQIEVNLDGFTGKLSELSYKIDEEISGYTFGSIAKIYSEIHNLRVNIDIIEDQI